MNQRKYERLLSSHGFQGKTTVKAHVDKGSKVTVVPIGTLQDASDLDGSFTIIVEPKDNKHLIHFVEHMYPGRVYYNLEDLL